MRHPPEVGIEKIRQQHSPVRQFGDEEIRASEGALLEGAIHDPRGVEAYPREIRHVEGAVGEVGL